MLAAVAAADVPALVVASSIGVYSPGPKERVDESWPREGIQTSWYSRHKAELERRLDRFESEQATRVVRLRPALIMKRGSAESVRASSPARSCPAAREAGPAPGLPAHS